jgi:aminobenzoyl-glutamate utilization protein A
MSYTPNKEQEAAINEKMIQWRRDFHQYAESGWLEFRTATRVAEELHNLGYSLALGKDVIRADARMGLPSEEILKKHEQRAREQGAIEHWLPYFSGGFTGLVATLETGRPGPTIGFRVDMDALDLEESEAHDHCPTRNGFRSVNPQMMHACGHDGHTAIGLGLAHHLIAAREQLSGCIKLIFQPAEEGTRGAKSMAEAGVVDDVDYFIAIHLGTGVPEKEVVCGSENFLATTKFNVDFHGRSAHAGGNPEEGHNALLAAAQATLGMHAISRHSEGASRINVGVLDAGTGRNIIAQHAHLKVESRGGNNDINQYIFDRCCHIIEGAAAMYEVEASIDVVGAARQCLPSPQWVKFVAEQAETLARFQTVHHAREGASGSEDATYFMERVKELGGEATYVIFGTALTAGHHNDQFDFRENVLTDAVALLFQVASQVSDYHGKKSNQ